MAAGLTLSEEKFEDFKKAFLSFAESNLTEEDMEPRLKLDAEIRLNDINSRFMRFLELLGPYGPGNMRPKFAARNLKVAGNPRIVGNGNHIHFRVKQERTSFPAIGFKLSEHYGVPLHPYYNLFWHDLRKKDVEQLAVFLLENAFQAFWQGFPGVVEGQQDTDELRHLEQR